MEGPLYRLHISSQSVIKHGSQFLFLIDLFLKIFSSETACSYQFWLIWQSDFRGEEFLKINQSETSIACGGHVCKQIWTKWAILIENLP
jgi:hypothetical protein